MKSFIVTGMTCAACSSRVEKAVSQVKNVDSCSVSLLTNTLEAEGSFSDQDIFEAVKKAGYGIKNYDSGPSEGTADARLAALEDTQTPVLKMRLGVSLVFLAALLYISMLHSMFGLPLPDFIGSSVLVQGILQLILASVLIVINQSFFITGLGCLKSGAANMNTLVSLGAASSYISSVCTLLLMASASEGGNREAVLALKDGFYFESAGTILTLITAGKLLEAKAKGRTTDALKNLLCLTPKTAVIIEDGAEKLIDADKIKEGQIFIVKPGEAVPADGVIIEGFSSLNEASLTGESVPADKGADDSVYASSLNLSGFLKCRAVRVGDDTSLAQIIKLVSEAASSKAPITRLADKVSAVFVPSVIGIACITFVCWICAGETFGYALARAVSVLVVSCPCALGLAAPAAVMTGSGVGAKMGILFKNAAALETAGKAEIIVFDKTGTITEGSPRVCGVLPAFGISEDELLRCAAALEAKSEHPLSKAVMQEAERLKISYKEASAFSAVPGLGVKAKLDGRALFGGNYKFISGFIKDDGSVSAGVRKLAELGITPLLFCSEDRFLGIIACCDKIKESSYAAVSCLKDMKIKVCMLTGDNEYTAAAAAAELGIEDVRAGVLPQDKNKAVKELKTQGITLMTGDGINDAPALAEADAGIAVGSGTDAALDAADIVLMKSRLTDVCAAVSLSRAVMINIKQNLFWAFAYNAVCIPIAAGAFAFMGIKFNPMLAALAMSLSSFCVVSNALRLNLFKFSVPQDCAASDSSSEGLDCRAADLKAEISRIRLESAAELIVKRITIEGMTCPHCESFVRQALEALEGVQKAEVSHIKKLACVTLNKDIADAVLKKAVEDEDYEVIEIV